MSATLAAIETRDEGQESFRESVVDALLGLERPDSVLGSYSITSEGDTTLCEVQAYKEGGRATAGTVCAPG